jgi:aspartyl-tRNA(Asn)/glutamyl-tRNA(Gln) amidotransferase subunit B
MTEVLRKLKQDSALGDDDDALLARCPVPPASLAEMIRLIDAGTISGKIAKDVFERMWTSGEPARAIVEREGLTQVSDEASIRTAIDDVIAVNPAQVATYRRGKTGTLGWFVGQVMRKTGGKANPQLVNDLLKKALAG